LLAERIPDAKLVELPGVDSLPWTGEAEAVLEQIELFLTGERRAPEPDLALATVLITDVVDSTAQSAAMGDRGWRDVLDEHDRIVRAELGRARGREIKTMGDGFLATFDGPARAIGCATAIAEAVRAQGIEIRAGLHTGEIQTLGEDVGGIGVSIGARVAAMAGPSEVLVSQTVKDLVAGSGFVFEDAGEHELKGIPDRWHLYRVIDA
jgi:class 3 adenylate cyclase